MKYVLILTVLVLAGCAPSDPQSYDQCMRREIFMQCMQALPAGPLATKYNDWDEVVSECGSQAVYLSMRRQSRIPVECRP